MSDSHDSFSSGEGASTARHLYPNNTVCPLLCASRQQGSFPYVCERTEWQCEKLLCLLAQEWAIQGRLAALQKLDTLKL